MKKLSPFQELLKAIENEVYDFELECRCHKLDELNVEFCKGYRAAINSVLTVALSIYNRGLKAKYLILDVESKETTDTLIEAFKKRG